MNINKLTLKAQETSASTKYCYSNHHQAIENSHLLKAMIDEDKEVIAFLFQKSGANAKRISQANDAIINTLPKVQGGETYLSNNANNALAIAEKKMKELGDEYVTNEKPGS